MKFLLKIPFLIIILVIFNLTILSNEGALKAEAVPLFPLSMPSGAIWHAYKGDFIVMGGVFLLFLSLLKTAKLKTSSIVERTISIAILAVIMIEFMIWPAACNSTCVLLMVIFLVDIVGNFVINTSSRRDFNIDGIH